MNPIQYTSRTYQTVMNDINSDPDLVDKPEWFKRIMAGVADVLSMCLDAQANNLYLETAFTRDAVRKLTALIGYKMQSATTSAGRMKFYLTDKTVFPITLSRQELRASYGSGNYLQFESRNDLTVREYVEVHTCVAQSGGLILTDESGLEEYDKVSYGDDYGYVHREENILYISRTAQDIALKRYVELKSGTYTFKRYTATTTCYQQRSQDSKHVGTSDGITSWQSFQLPDQDIIADTIQITINDEIWTQVDDFDTDEKGGRYYKVEYDSAGNAKVCFGNGTYGEIPGNFPIYAEYATGGGRNSNVSNVGAVTTYTGTSAYIDGCFNVTSMNGGNNVESITDAKKLAPLSLRSRDRFVTVEDGLTLIYRLGQSSLAKIDTNYYGSLSCRVMCVANGGGNLSEEIQQELQQYLIDRSVLGSLDVRVVDAQFHPVSVSLRVGIASGYAFQQVSPYVSILLKIYFSECNKEILDAYDEDGYGVAIDLINRIFSTEYSVTDEQLHNALEYMGKTGTRGFGETLYESTVTAMLSTCIKGITHIIYVNNPFPIAIGSDEVSTVGTYDVQESI